MDEIVVEIWQGDEKIGEWKINMVQAVAGVKMPFKDSERYITLKLNRYTMSRPKEGAVD